MGGGGIVRKTDTFQKRMPSGTVQNEVNLWALLL